MTPTRAEPSTTTMATTTTTLRSVLLGLTWCLVVCLAADIPWWQKATIYQVYPRSLKDNDGDGVGDLKGITSKLDYLASIGVNAIWISPVYKSPMADFGYDIADFRDIDPIFGTLADADELIAEAHTRGVKVIMDFVPNHSSDEHEWFKKAVDPSDPDHQKYKDYYCWMDSKVPGEQVPPNNWPSAWSDSGWKWVDANQQFYLHQFHEKQPDLNYRNPELVEEMKDILRFWMDRGVDGFRMDAVQTIFEVVGYPDIVQGQPDPRSNQPETYEMIQEFRKVVDEYPDRVMMTEAYGPLDVVLDFYGNATNPGAHFSFNFLLITDLHGDSSADDFYRVTTSWVNAVNERGVWSNWVSGNHDQRRVSGRYGSVDYVDVVNMLDQLLPGTAVTYYGDEIGMEDNMKIPCNESHDPAGCQDGVNLGGSRDPERTPFQSDASTNAGFSSGRPWLPINENYLQVNAEAETADPRSHLSVYKKLLQLRTSDVVQVGDFVASTLPGNVFTFTRNLEGQESVVVAVNVGTDPATVNFLEAFPLDGKHLMVQTQSANSDLDEAAMIAPNSVTLAPKSAVAFLTMTDA